MKAIERKRVCWLLTQLMWNCAEPWGSFPALFRYRVLKSCVQTARQMPTTWEPADPIAGINRSLTGHWIHKSRQAELFESGEAV